MNIREMLRAAAAPKPVEVRIADLADPVYVRMLTVGEILEQTEDTKDGDNRPAIARALARVLVNADGSPVYDAGSPESLQEIMKLPWPIVRAIMEPANKLNGLATGEAGKG
jgi:hypothetical protein